MAEYGGYYDQVSILVNNRVAFSYGTVKPEELSDYGDWSSPPERESDNFMLHR